MADPYEAKHAKHNTARQHLPAEEGRIYGEDARGGVRGDLAPGRAVKYLHPSTRKPKRFGLYKIHADGA